jgi:NAD+ synthase (glutamine-hydrolysing)
MKDCKIALAQINPSLGDLDGNTSKIIDFVRKARKQRADLVVFPELAITGYPPKDLLLKTDFITRNKKKLKEIAQETHNISAVIGLIDMADNRIYNAAALIQNDRIVGIQHKTSLPNYDVFDEERYFQTAENSAVYSLNGLNVGITICEDIWVDNSLINGLAEKGADFIINISASPFYAGKLDIRRRLISKRAKENNIPIVYVNMVGGQDDLIFDGRSCVFNKDGTLIAQAKQFEEDLIVVGLDGKKIVTKDNIIQEVHDALVLGIRDYTRKNGFRKAVIGLSGGIDSAVTSVLAVKALGREKVIGVSMPSDISSKESVGDARRLARKLGIKLKVIPISDTYNSYIKTLRPEFKGTAKNVAEENIQARIRGNILMALSNKFGYLVLSTGNKSELAVGYCTLYGDMSGGLAVLSDVLKTRVYELADYINRKREVIPRGIITKEPSAELRPGQKDTDTLPPYRILDPILNAYIEENKSRDEIIRLGFKKRLVDKVIWMVDHNEYKRQQAPLGLKITPKAFGSGRRMPITNLYEL